MNRALVIIPTYNEVDNIERIIKRIFLEESFDVLVVDDSSPDGTADRVIELTPHFKNRLFLEGNHKKRGIGKAYLIGFEWALKRKYNFIFQIDADLSHDPKELPKMLRGFTRMIRQVRSMASEFSRGLQDVADEIHENARAVVGGARSQLVHSFQQGARRSLLQEIF